MSLKILVAEDDANTRAALVEILRSDGHAVTEAADGLHAKFLFDKQPPEMACLDVMMPGMSGYDLCRHIRQSQPRLPILFITAKAEEIDKVVGLELGADDYIVKPFGAKEVLARIRAVARRSVGDPKVDNGKPVFSQGDFSMNGLDVLPRQLRAKRGEEVLRGNHRDHPQCPGTRARLRRGRVLAVGRAAAGGRDPGGVRLPRAGPRGVRGPGPGESPRRAM